MSLQQDFIKLLIQISIAFGSVFTILLSSILYFVKGKAKIWDDGIDKMHNHETRITVSETKIIALEKIK